MEYVDYIGMDEVYIILDWLNPEKTESEKEDNVIREHTYNPDNIFSKYKQQLNKKEDEN